MSCHRRELKRLTCRLILLQLVLLSLLALGTLSGSASVAIPFDAPDLLPTAVWPKSIAIADFNGDSKPDVAVGALTGNLEVLVNQGRGTFVETTSTAIAGGRVQGVAADDVNGDGNQDLLAACNPDSLRVYLGDGTGDFTTFIEYPVQMQPADVAVGDLNNDGLPDAVLGKYNDFDAIAVFMNSPAGFLPPQYQTISTVTRIVLADFNGDSKLDLAGTQYLTQQGWVALGTGDGTFAALHSFATGSSPLGIDRGDLNNDGSPDLAVANYQSGEVSVLFNNGSGQFTGQNIKMGARTSDVTIGDFDNDGLLDIAATNLHSDTVSVLHNDGAGDFSTTQNISLQSPYAIAASDLDGNGKLDLVASNWSIVPAWGPITGGLSFIFNDRPPRPAVSAARYSTDRSATTTVKVSWSARSPSRVIVAFDVDKRVGPEGRWAGWRRNTSTMRKYFTGSVGTTYYFRARGTDTSRITSGWSTARPVAVPYDQSAATFKGRWQTRTGTKLFRGTSRYSSIRGATASRRFRNAMEVALIITKSIRGGKADVYLGDVKAATVDFYAARTRFRVPIRIKTFTNPTPGTIRVVVKHRKSRASLGYRVEIDGVGVKT